jgi:hypothetical protein
MKKVCLLSLVLCAGVFAQNNTIVRWRGIQGVITAPGVDNPVSQIHSGAGPWTAQRGDARLNLVSGEGSFEVEGLVLNGGNASGTPGAVGSVMGTFVCNPAARQERLRRSLTRRSRASVVTAKRSSRSGSTFRQCVTIQCF